MLIIQPSAELLHITPNALQLIERAGRTCYKSEEKITDESAGAFVKMLMKRKHFSVLEHASATFRFITDRGVTHEMVRHRLAAYSQESTRYCNYTKDKFQGHLRFIKPPFAVGMAEKFWEAAMEDAERYYQKIIECGEPPQIARSVLPNSLKTEIVMTCNFREWLHVFDLRTDPGAHPQIRFVMIEALIKLSELYPEVFGDIHA